MGCGDGRSVAGVVGAKSVGIGDNGVGEGETGGGMGGEMVELEVEVQEPKSKEFISWDIRGIGPEGVCGGEMVDLGWTEAYGKIFS